MSDWIIFLDIPGQPAYGNKYPVNPTEVTDISRVPVSIKHYANHYMPNNSSVMINPDGTLTKSIKTPSWWGRLKSKLEDKS